MIYGYFLEPAEKWSQAIDLPRYPASRQLPENRIRLLHWPDLVSGTALSFVNHTYSLPMANTRFMLKAIKF